MKQAIFLFLLSISIIHLLNSCAEESEVTTLNTSEIYVLNNCQLSCIDDYERSESLKLELETLKLELEISTYPQSSELSNIANNVFAFTERLDSITRIVIKQINQLKIKTIERSSDKETINKRVVINERDVFGMSPVIVDLEHIQLNKQTQSRLPLPSEIQLLRKNIELLRKYYIDRLIAYFEFQNWGNLDQKKQRNFQNFSEQYKMIEQSKKKVRSHLCGTGLKYRIEQINLCLSYNNYQWKELSSTKSSLPIIMNELTSLQADLFKTRIKVFELFQVHLHCQRLILRDKEKEKNP